MNSHTILWVAVSVALFCLPCVARTTPLAESFSGRGLNPSENGELTGFDHPGWTVVGEATLDDGLHFVDMGVSEVDANPETATTFVRRSVIGTGGFSAVLRVEDLDFKFFDDPMSGSELNVCFIGAFSGNRQSQCGSLVARGNAQDTWAAVFTATQAVVSVPTTNNVELIFEFNEEANEFSMYVRDLANGDGSRTLVGSDSATGNLDGQFVLEISSITRGLGGATGALASYSNYAISDRLGDFDGDGELGVDDISYLERALQLRLDSAGIDINNDSVVDREDLTFWVKRLRNTYFGDANIDGEFASSDLVLVFGAGEYEDEILSNSSWSTGDWNGDGDFTSSDLVLAFQDGGYEQGPRAAVVPEPSGVAALALGALSLFSFRSRRR